MVNLNFHLNKCKYKNKNKIAKWKNCLKQMQPTSVKIGKISTFGEPSQGYPRCPDDF